jgi:cyclase
MTMRDVDSSNVQHHVASPWPAQYRRTDEADYETSQEASECDGGRDPGDRSPRSHWEQMKLCARSCNPTGAPTTVLSPFSWDIEDRLPIMKHRALRASWFILLTLLPFRGAADTPEFTLRKIGDGVWAVVSSDNGKAFANAGFVVGDNGVAVIDTFQDPEAAKALLAEIRKISKLPIRFVVNTHYHIDHVNGNDVFAAAGATIVAHRNVRAWMRSENLKFWPDPIPADAKARVQSLSLPDLVYDDGVDLYLGTRTLEVRSYPGHTGGDSIVIVPDAHVVFCGDLLWKDHFPNLIDATTESWIPTLATLRSNYGPATFVPGHGELATARDVATFEQYLVELRAAIKLAQAAGKSGDAVVEAVLPGIRTKYGDWAFLDDYARDDIRQTTEELSGHKKIPVPAAAAGRQ